MSRAPVAANRSTKAEVCYQFVKFPTVTVGSKPAFPWAIIGGTKYRSSCGRKTVVRVAYTGLASLASKPKKDRLLKWGNDPEAVSAILLANFTGDDE